MIKRLLVATALILVCLDLSAATKRKSKKAEPPPKPVVMGTAAGMIKNAGSAGIPNVTVTIWDEKKKAVTAQSNASGEFRMPLPEGTYEVAATVPHFTQVVPTHITIVVHGNQETWVNIVMAAAP